MLIIVISSYTYTRRNATPHTKGMKRQGDIKS